MFIWSNFNSLHNSPWITLPTQSCTVFYSFLCIRLLCDWSFCLYYHVVYICFFCCVWAILALIWLVLMAFFCAAIIGYSVSLLRFPFLGPVCVFSCEKLFISHSLARSKYLSLFSFSFLFLPRKAAEYTDCISAVCKTPCGTVYWDCRIHRLHLCSV